MLELARGAAQKMPVQLAEPAQYQLRLGDQSLDANALLGKSLQLEFLGSINCTHCNRATKKSFGQG